MVPNSLFVNRVNESIDILVAVAMYRVIVFEEPDAFVESDREHRVMGSTLRFAPYDDAHVLSVNAELSKDKILCDREILTVTAALQKLRQGLPLVAGRGLRADAIILVALPVDVAIHQANLLLGPEVCSLQKDMPKTPEPPRAGLCVTQTLVNSFTLGIVSVHGLLPSRPAGGGREKVLGGIE